MLPFGNVLAVNVVSGTALLAALENGVGGAPGVGQYPQVGTSD